MRGKRSGLPKGVFAKRAKFAARIKAKDTYLNIGVFDTPEEAAEAYLKAATRLHGEFARSVFTPATGPLLDITTEAQDALERERVG